MVIALGPQLSREKDRALAVLQTLSWQISVLSVESVTQRPPVTKRTFKIKLNIREIQPCSGHQISEMEAYHLAPFNIAGTGMKVSPPVQIHQVSLPASLTVNRDRFHGWSSSNDDDLIIIRVRNGTGTAVKKYKSKCKSNELLLLTLHHISS